ncbi:endoribonuclease CG2145-like isoform X2 [Diachasmimorpha longicaudata]|uniref:endoribonuclease CG2145-like isoform X2 n=1 Tax=Diachasmimorpha longicaudata TaxID=58733 RepID=UPI0030B8811E
MMAKKAFIVLLAVTLTLLVEDTEAGWKFWKKDKSTTTETPITSTTTTTTIPPVSNSLAPGNGNAPGSRQPTGSVTNALAGAANPGLAIGVGNSGQNIRDNARPQRPNPGTEVGQDFPGSKPANPATGGGTGQGYRDWAADLTGAGDPSKPAPKLPSTGPALSSGGPTPGLTRPSGSNSSQPVAPNSPQSGLPASRPASPALGLPASRPASPASGPVSGPASPALGPVSGPVSPTGAQGNRQGPPPLGPRPVSTGGTTGGSSTGQTGNDRPQVSSINVGPITPAPPNRHSSGYPSLPGSPSSPGASSPGGPTWAEVAGRGSHPGSPTPAPRPSGQPITGQTGGRISPGAVVGGLAGGAAAAGLATSGPKKIYSSNPTYSKGNSVTDDDLEKLAEALWIKDKNNAWKYITLNLQKQTSSSSQKDEAPQPLLKVKDEAFQIPTIEKVLTIYDNYKLDSREAEYMGPLQRNEESLLVDTFLSTNVMSAAMRFLANKGYLRQDYYHYKETLRRMWFNLYPRGGETAGSTGFEHVFLTELKLGTEVSGLHNWIYFDAAEKNRRADYLGYIKKLDLGDKAAILKLHTKFNNIDKPVTTMFIGTSPELEMALYTVCFFVRSEQPCPVSLGGSKFNIITHKIKRSGSDLIGSAYPDI